MKRTIFICQILDGDIRILKCAQNAKKIDFLELQDAELPADYSDTDLFQRLEKLLKNLRFNNHHFIFCLPRSQVSTRFLKIPSTTPDEIENIASLQASRFLPYPSEKLVTGYQVVSRDQTGHTNICLAIAHESAVQRYIEVFRRLKIAKISIRLSSEGLGSLHNYLEKDKADPAMVLNMDLPRPELAILANGKLLYSRAFGINNGQEQGLPGALAKEIHKTLAVYGEEVSKKFPKRLEVFPASGIRKEFWDNLSKEIDLPVKEHLFPERLKIPAELSEKLKNINSSSAQLFGLAIGNNISTFKLFTRELKEKNREELIFKRNLNAGILAAAVILVWALGLVFSINNKQHYLNRLKNEIARLSAEATTLERMEKQLNSSKSAKNSILQGISAIYLAAPAQITLSSLKYEKDRSFTLLGTSGTLQEVFNFANQLSASAALSKFDVKISYAKRRKAGAQTTDFGIICAKKGG